MTAKLTLKFLQLAPAESDTSEFLGHRFLVHRSADQNNKAMAPQTMRKRSIKRGDSCERAERLARSLVNHVNAFPSLEQRATGPFDSGKFAA